MVVHATKRLSLADCVREMDTPGADLTLVQESIRQWAEKPLTETTENLLRYMWSQTNVTEKALSRYLYYKAKRIALEQLFPYQIVDRPGEVNKQSGRVKQYYSKQSIIRISKGGNAKSFEPGYFHETEPGYIVNMPLVLGLDRKKNIEELRRITTLFQMQSFSGSETKSEVKIQTRLALVLGANRCKSLDKGRNNLFKKFITDYQMIIHYEIKLFGFFWKPVWQKNVNGTPQNVSMKKVSKYFRALQKIDPELAETIRKKHEEPDTGIYKRVPYQEIRETVKNSYFTQEAVSRLRSYYIPRLLYLAIMDPDCNRLRNDGKGLFSHYNRIVKDKLASDESAPTFMSTGYKAPHNAPPLIKLTIELDQKARAAMAEYFPGAPYLPEPNLMIKILPDTDTVEETFMDAAVSGLESRHIVKHVLEGRELDKLQAIVFQTLGAIPTAIPNRFFTDKNRSMTPLTYEIIGQKQILKTLRGVTCQSHISPLWGWAYNIARELSVNGSPAINKALTRVLAIFDPITLAKEYESGKYTIQKNFKPMMKMYRHYHNAMLRVYRRLLRDSTANKIKPHAVNVTGEITSFLEKRAGLSLNQKTDLLRRCNDEVTSLVEIHNQLIGLNVPLTEMSNIIFAAAAVGKSIHQSFANLIE